MPRDLFADDGPPVAARGRDLFADDGPPVAARGRDLFADDGPPVVAPKANIAPSVQGLLRMPADTLGLPVDMVTWAANSLAAPVNGLLSYFGGEKAPQIPEITKPFLGSEDLAERASNVGKSFGLRPAEPDDMTFGGRVGYEASRFASGALTGASGARLLANSGKVAPFIGRVASAIRAPYEEAAQKAAAMPSGSIGEMLAKGYQQARPRIQDVAGGIGAGAGVAAVQQTPWADSPLGNMVAALLGGAMGASSLRPGEAVAKTVSNLGKNLSIDPGAGRTSLGLPVTEAVSEGAARFAQGNALDPAAAAARISERAKDFKAGGYARGETPTTGIMSNDAGLIATERAYRTRPDTAPKFGAQDKATASKAGSDIKNLADNTAKPRAATDYAGAVADQKELAAQARVERAQIAKDRAGRNEQKLGASVATPPKSEAAASRSLDSAVVEKGLRPAQKTRTGLYENRAKAASDMAVPLKDYRALSEDVGSGNGGVFGGSDQAKDLSSSLDSRVKTDKTTGETNWAGKPVSVGDFMKSAPAVSNEIRSASGASPNLNRKAAFEKVRDFTNDKIPKILEESGNPEAAAASRAATEFDKGSYFPVYGRGENKSFLDSLNADPDYRSPKSDRLRSDTPATATGSRYIKPGPDGTLELASDLRRMINASSDPDKGYKAARDILLNRLAGSNVLDSSGKVNPVRMKAFIRDYAGALDGLGAQGKAMRGELLTTLKDAEGRAANSSRMTQELENAKLAQQRELKDLGNSVEGRMRGADPTTAVQRIFSSPDPAKAMKEAVALFSNDPAAAAGFKRAVTDELHAKLTNPAGPASDNWIASYNKLAKTDRLRYEEVLSQIYSPGEREVLHRGRRVMADLQNRFSRGSVGSNTAEDTQGSLKIPLPLDVFYRFASGKSAMAAGGDIFKYNRLLQFLTPALENLPGVSHQAKVNEVLKRAWFDPELMQHLLTRPVSAEGYPAWNKALNRLLATGAAARESGPEDDKK